MIRKTLAFVLTLCLAISIVGVSLAEFDYSVFEDNANFEVAFDAMDDTGTISFTSEFKPMFGFTLKSDDEMVITTMDIFGIPDIATVIRLQFMAIGSYPDVEKVIFLPDKKQDTQ